jgi:hypothetical protein
VTRRAADLGVLQARAPYNQHKNPVTVASVALQVRNLWSDADAKMSAFVAELQPPCNSTTFRSLESLGSLDAHRAYFSPKYYVFVAARCMLLATLAATGALIFRNNVDWELFRLSMWRIGSQLIIGQLVLYMLVNIISYTHRTNIVFGHALGFTQLICNTGALVLGYARASLRRTVDIPHPRARPVLTPPKME